MTSFIESALEDYCYKLTHRESDALENIGKETQKRVRYPSNMSGRIVGQLLKMLVTISCSKVVLEIGMFTGYSTLSMAEGLPEDGVIYSCEVNTQMISMAQEFFAKSPHGKKIHILPGKALDTIKCIKQPLDMVFIDGDKKNYPQYFERTFDMLRSGGIMVVDDVLWKGMVINPLDERSIVIANLNQTIVKRCDVENVVLPVRGGINIIRKKNTSI